MPLIGSAVQWYFSHIAHLLFFPLTEEEKKNKEEEYIYFRIKFKSYFDRILPPIRYIYDITEWKDYFYHNYFNKVIIGLKYLFSKDYIRTGGILDCFEFQNKDLSKLDIFLSQITDKIDSKIGNESIELLDNNRWLIYLSIDRIIPYDEDLP